MALINTTTTGVLGTTLFGDGSGDLTVQKDGVTINKITTAPTFMAVKSATAQTFSSATATKITFDVELFDTNNNFASSRFTPTIPGYYQINAGISTSGTTSQSRAIVALYKNGSEFTYFQDLTVSSYRYGGSILVYLNGSTDYVEVYAYITATSPSVEGGIQGVLGYSSFFSGAMIRAA